MSKPTPKQQMLLNTLSGDAFLAVNKTLMQHLGLEKAVLLSSLLDTMRYHAAHGQLQETGAFWTTHEQQAERTAIHSPWKIARLKKELVKEGLIETKMAGLPAREHFWINSDAILALMEQNEPLSDPLELDAEARPSCAARSSDGSTARALDKQQIINNKATAAAGPPNNETRVDQVESVGLPKESKSVEGSNKKEASGERQRSGGSTSNYHITESMFDSFWSIYPKKTSKGQAKTTWSKVCKWPVKDRPSWQQIECAVTAQAKTPQWQEKRFIPHASTWLNQQRWLDDPEEMTTASFAAASKPDDGLSVFERIRQIAPDVPSIFTKRTAEQVERLFAGREQVEAVDNMQTILQTHSALSHRPSQERLENMSAAGQAAWRDVPMVGKLIADYCAWLGSNDCWVSQPSPKMLAWDHKVFQSWFRQRQQEVGLDFLTGKEI